MPGYWRQNYKIPKCKGEWCDKVYIMSEQVLVRLVKMFVSNWHEKWPLVSFASVDIKTLRKSRPHQKCTD